MNGAESLIRVAAEAGIGVCFANPGTTELPLVRALDDSFQPGGQSGGGVRAVLCLFEGVCTGAADGYGRMAGRPAMTLLHLGPGFANGIAYLHDARRARSPIVNLIGEHATWHRAADPPLHSDIESLAAPVSAWLRRATSSASLAADLREAIGVASVKPGRIATLIVPHDYQLGEVGGEVPMPAVVTSVSAGFAEESVRRAALALREPSQAALFIGGFALRERGLRAVGRIAAATGVRLICESFPTRWERGAGTPIIERLPYFPEPAMAMLSPYRTIILAGARSPVAFFGYPGLPSLFISPEQQTEVLAGPEEDVGSALEALAEAVGAARDQAVARRLDPPTLPTGALTPDAMSAVVAAMLPEGAIVMDEGNTSSGAFCRLSASGAPHSYLMQPGGAIGLGMPCATGAAIACPDRPVITLQSDGSGMYTVQALWTMAREGLNVKTIICNNRGYRILGIEMARAGITSAGPQAQSMVGIERPTIDWCAVSRGLGVPALRVDTAEGLASAFRQALAEPGPFLIEAQL